MTMHAPLRWQLTPAALAVLPWVMCGCADPDESWPDGPVAETGQAAVVCADGEELEGIDVSTYQDTVDWPAAAADGIVFAVARVNHGSVMDDQFHNNWPAMRANGVVRGAYQYFDPGGDPEWQATVLIDEVGALGPGDLPAVIDVESHDGQPPGVIADNVRTWLELVEAGTGRRPMIYTARYFWDDYVGTSEFADAGYPLWVANWTTGCPDLPSPWDDWVLWQYTDSGSVAGIEGPVDRDRFNGSMLQLQDWAANGYRAEVVSLSYPAAMGTGDSAPAQLVVRNAGARPWPTETRLGTTEPRDRESPFEAPTWLGAHRVAGLEEQVAPGDTVTIEFVLRAPSVPDAYVEHFNLLVEGTAWFSDINPGGGPWDDEIELRIDVRSSGGTGGSGGTGSGEGASESASGAQGIVDSGGGCALGRAAGRTGGGSLGWPALLAGVVVVVLARHRREHRPTLARG